MSEPTKTPEEGIVVGGKKNRMGVDIGSSVRKLVRPVFFLVVLAAIAAGGYYGWNYWNDHKTNKKAVSTAPKHVTVAQYTDNQIENAKQELANAKTPADKAKAYTKLSNLYANQQGGVDTAVVYARKLVAAEGTADAYSQLAFALDQAGDYQGSADAYNKAADLSHQGSGGDGRGDNSYYRNAAKQEEAKL